MVGCSATLPIREECIQEYDFTPISYVELPAGRVLTSIEGREKFNGISGEYNGLRFNVSEKMRHQESKRHAEVSFYALAANHDSVRPKFEGNSLEDSIANAKSRMLDGLKELGIMPLDLYVEILPKRY